MFTLHWVGFWLPTYHVSFFHSIGRIFHKELNRQLLHSEMGTSPLSPNSLGSYQTGRVLYEEEGHLDTLHFTTPTEGGSKKYD